MKKLIAAIVLATPAVAIAADTTATVQDHYKEVIVKVPETVEVCRETAAKGDDLGAAILGGAIGSAVGNHVSGADGAGAIGAILGMAFANENQKTEGGLQCHTETRYSEERKTVYSHSTVRFMDQGVSRTLTFNR